MFEIFLYTFAKTNSYDHLKKKKIKLKAEKVELGAAFLSGNPETNPLWGLLWGLGAQIDDKWGGYYSAWWDYRCFIDDNETSPQLVKQGMNCIDRLYNYFLITNVLSLDQQLETKFLDYINSTNLFKTCFHVRKKNNPSKILLTFLLKKFALLKSSFVGITGVWQQQFIEKIEIWYVTHIKFILQLLKVDKESMEHFNKYVIHQKKKCCR